MEVDQEISPSIVDGILNFLQPHQDNATENSATLREILALCPYCGLNCQQTLTEELLFRKKKHQCTGCQHETCPCDNFDTCGGAAKSFPLWDDGLCILCSMERREHDDWISNIVQQLSPMKDDEPRIIDEAYLSTLHDQEGRNEAKERALNPPPATDLSQIDLKGASDMEDWEIVRDALMAWPGPEQSDVLSAQHCVSRKAFTQRWVNASKQNLADCAQKLMKHCVWRRESHIDKVWEEDWSEFEKRGEMYVSGVDKHGRPSCTWRVALHDANFATPEQYTRFLITIVERTRSVNPDAERIHFILDCSGMSFSSYDHNMFLLCAKHVQENYPDNVEHIFVFPVGWLLNTVLNIGRPFLAADTLSKMSFMVEGETTQELLRHFGDEEVEERLGGTLKIEKAQQRVNIANTYGPRHQVSTPLHPRVLHLHSLLLHGSAPDATQAQTDEGPTSTASASASAKASASAESDARTQPGRAGEERVQRAAKPNVAAADMGGVREPKSRALAQSGVAQGVLALVWWPLRWPLQRFQALLSSLLSFFPSGSGERSP